VRRVELLRAEADLPFRDTDDGLTFTIPRIEDYEVAAVYIA
jgi:hypothetical protein